MAGDSVEVNWSDFELRKHFECPVCLEEPQNVVYQCGMGGHIICKDCYVDLINKNVSAKCPVCRTPLPSKRFIRNNFFERLVASLKDISGLKVNPTGNGTLANEVSCEDSQHFGNRDVIKVNLCRLLGFLDCNFGTSNKNTKEAVKHLVSQHGCILSKSDKFKLKLPNFKKSDGKTDDNEFWTPVIVELKEQQGFLVIMTLCKKGSDSVGWFSLFLPFHNKTELSPPVEVEIVTKTEEASRQSFIQNPTTLQKLQAFSSFTCPFHYQMSALSPSMTGEGALLVTCQVRATTPGFADEQFNLERIPKTKVQIDEQPKLSKLNKCLSFLCQVPFWIILALCMVLVAYVVTNTNWKPAYSHKTIDKNSYTEISPEQVTDFLTMSFEEFQINMINNPERANLVFRESPHYLNMLFLALADEDKERAFLKVQFLVEQMGANVNHKLISNETPLHFAARYRNVAAVEYFLKIGLDVNAQDYQGDTALHYIVKIDFKQYEYFSRERWDIINFLLKNGADCHIENKYGDIALGIDECLKIQSGELSLSQLNDLIKYYS